MRQSKSTSEGLFSGVCLKGRLGSILAKKSSTSEVRSKDAFVRVALFSSLDPSPGPSSTIDNCTNLAVDKDAV